MNRPSFPLLILGWSWQVDSNTTEIITSLASRYIIKAIEIDIRVLKPHVWWKELSQLLSNYNTFTVNL